MPPTAEPRAPEDADGWLVAVLRRAGATLQRVPRARAWLPVALWMGLIWMLSASSFQGAARSPSLGFLGNLGHAPLFGLLALWAALLLPRAAGWPRLSAGDVALVLAGVLAWGAVDELHQSGVAGRDFSLLDLLTDLCGAACVLWIAAYAGRPQAGEGGLRRRLAAALGLCGLCAALATWLPVAFPGAGWM